MKESELQMITLTELRRDQLETIVSSLIGENAELKERVKKLEQEKIKSTEPAAKSNKEDSCVHNDYVAYIYNLATLFGATDPEGHLSIESFVNVYPKIDPFSGTNADYEKWQAGMSKPVLNFHNNNICTISLLSDDGEVTKYKCNLCGKEITVDRRLITFSE